MNSYNTLKEFKDKLVETLNKLDEIYYQTRFELKKELSNEQEKIISYNKELKQFYDKHTFSDFEKMIRKKLPFIFKLFRVKVYVYGIALTSESSYNCIKVYYSYDIHSREGFCYEFHLEDLKTK